MNVEFRKEQYAGWMKEDRLCLLVDPKEDGLRLQRKKTRLRENSYVDECLYKWFLQKHSERVPINGVILKGQAIQLNKLLSRDETFQASEGLEVEGLAWNVAN
jgi:hypothetical protein